MYIPGHISKEDREMVTRLYNSGWTIPKTITGFTNIPVQAVATVIKEIETQKELLATSELQKEG